MSAGTISPAHKLMTSPGTNSLRGISSSWPSRTTAAVTLIIALSFAAAASARDSCTKRNATPSISISVITVPPLKSPVAKDTVARMASRMTNRLRVALKSRHNQPRCFSNATALGPCLIRRSSASVLVRPTGEVLNLVKTSPFSKYADSVRIGETPIEAAFGLGLG